MQFRAMARLGFEIGILSVTNTHNRLSLLEGQEQRGGTPYLALSTASCTEGSLRDLCSLPKHLAWRNEALNVVRSPVSCCQCRNGSLGIRSHDSVHHALGEATACYSGIFQC